jgi:DNA invertase Pin-like site-specific DNA recombinase
MPAQQAAIYVRISKDREGLELGVERQEEDCTKIAERLGLPVYRIYKDNDLSGSKFARKSRPEYQQMLKDAEAGFFCTIIAYKSSRLTRRPLEHEAQITLAEKHGIRFAYVASPAFDLNTAAGRFVARTLAAVDANQAEETSELISRKKLEGAQRGQYLGGYRAYGYEGAQYDDEGKLTNQGRINIALIQQEADIYRLCVQRIIGGERISAIVHDLNAQGVPSPDGKLWNYGNTRRILLKKRYVIFDDSDPEKRGTLEHHGKEYRAAWPGLISRSTYELMVARLKEIGQNWKHGMSDGHAYLLTSLLECGECEGRCYGNGRYLKNGTYQRRYRCRYRDSSGNIIGCGCVFRGSDPLDDYVTEKVLAKLDSQQVRTSLLADPDDDESLITELLTKLDSQQNHRKQLVVEYGQGLHSRQDYKLMLDSADDAIALTQASLAKARHSTVTNLLPAGQSVRAVWPTASLDWKRAVIQLVVEKIVVNKSKPGSHLYKDKWRFKPEDNEIVWREVAQAELEQRLSQLLELIERARQTGASAA